jgi:hypothetical protein
LTLQTPSAMFGNVKLPVAFATVVVDRFVRVSVAVTVAPGNARPLWSEMVPSSVARHAAQSQRSDLYRRDRRDLREYSQC